MARLLLVAVFVVHVFVCQYRCAPAAAGMPNTNGETRTTSCCCSEHATSCDDSPMESPDTPSDCDCFGCICDGHLAVLIAKCEVPDDLASIHLDSFDTHAIDGASCVRIIGRHFDRAPTRLRGVSARADQQVWRL